MSVPGKRDAGIAPELRLRREGMLCRRGPPWAGGSKTVSPEVRASHPGVSQVDEMMEHASVALVENRYFDAASIARRALLRSRQMFDFERMSRICLPLQEATRQIRMIAVDAAREVSLVMSAREVAGALRPGCVLLQPPLIGADARALRVAAERSKVPMVVLTREPLTRTGEWPIVGVARISVRARVSPPFELARDDSTLRKDQYAGDPPIPMTWFEAAHEALGDAAIAMDNQHRHAWWRVDDAIERLEAVPEHEKLHQHLAKLCRAAAGASPPEETRRPGLQDDPSGF